MLLFVTVFYLLGTFQLQYTSGQLSSFETLNTLSYCQYSSINLDCGNELIAVEAVVFGYRVGCESQCCSFLGSDCFVNATVSDIEYVSRTCSGHQACNLDLASSHDFCSFGTLQPSYVTVQFYCIPGTRVSSICSSSTISSDGPPLYLTNVNYPSVTTGDNDCSCSLEVYECSSSINIYIIDADLYFDTSHCNQSLDFVDGSNTTLMAINCESYYNSSVEAQVLNTHYLKINFYDDEVQDQEGYFFLGFAASLTNATFSITCQSQLESWCVGCGTLPTILFGYFELDDTSNFDYEATASVFCDDGYESNAPKVICLANGSWENVACSAKDCGSELYIRFGSASLTDADNSTFGASAYIACNTGYQTSKAVVTCEATGEWENSTCEPKDCGSNITVTYGSATLNDVNNSTYGALATVICFYGYVHVASKASITCKETGFWDTATCTPVDCGQVPSVMHGRVVLKDNSNTTYAAGADIVCDTGYRTSKEMIVCLSTGLWENVTSCTLEDITSGTGGNTDNEQSDASEEGKGLGPGLTAVIVIVCVLFIFAVLIALLFLLWIKSRDNTVTPENGEEKADKTDIKIPVSDDSEKITKTDVNGTAKDLTKRTPLPEIPHKVKHGPIYIDHGEAHIFGLMIHLPFGGQSHLDPITDSNMNESYAKEKKRKRKKKKRNN